MSCCGRAPDGQDRGTYLPYVHLVLGATSSRRQVSPLRIVAVTFTERAAGEMRLRVGALDWLVRHPRAPVDPALETAPRSIAAALSRTLIVVVFRTRARFEGSRRVGGGPDHHCPRACAAIQRARRALPRESTAFRVRCGDRRAMVLSHGRAGSDRPSTRATPRLAVPQ